MSRLQKLVRKWRRRDAGAKRQRKKYQQTGKEGHRRKWREHVAARKFIRKVIKREKALQNRPSPNFAYSEFDCKDGTPVPKAAYPALDHLCQTYLEPLRAEFGPVSITSGYRHADYNRRIGGASMSVHIYDYPGRNGQAVAADITCQRGTPAQWAKFLERLNPAGLGTYRSFVHLDNRDRMGWPRSRWTG